MNVPITRRLRLFCLLFLLAAGPAYTASAQENQLQVTGTVRNRQGELLPNVSIMAVNTKTNFSVGVQTDSIGIFHFSGLPPGAGYVFTASCIGFETQTLKGFALKAGITLTLAIRMEKSSGPTLNDIVVVGYGSMRKKDMTGSSSRIDEQQLKETPPTTIEDAMQGKAAGLTVTNTSAEPGGGISLQVRGVTSLSGTNQPLYVIDGIPLYNDNSRAAPEFASNVSPNALASLNPSDIVSIEVLKDASATAIYGSRGANGVIMITTKRGRPGKAVIQLDQYTTAAMRPKLIKLATAKEYAGFINEMAGNDGLPNPYNGKYLVAPGGQDSIYFATPDQLGTGTNWQQEITRPAAVTENYQLSASGGNEFIRYLLSGNYLNDQGIVRYSSYKKGSFRSNFDIKINNRLNAKFDFNAVTDQNNRAENSNGFVLTGGAERSGVILKSFVASPALSTDNQASRISNQFSSVTPLYTSMLNPLYDLANTINQRTTKNFFATLELDYKLAEGLTLTARGMSVTNTTNIDEFWNNNTQLGYSRGQMTYQVNYANNTYINEDYLTYMRSSSKYSLNIVAGGSWQKSTTRYTALEEENLPVPVSNGLYLTPLYGIITPPFTYRADQTLLSGYGRGVFSYLGKYMLTVTARTDGSSNFAVNKKWAFFPAAGIGWNFTEEKFLSGLRSVLSNGKLRVSYGTSGNQAIAAFQSLATLSPLSFGFVNGVATGVITNTPGNSNLTWETTKQADLGLELGFFQDKYKLTFDVYRKRTDNLLQTKTIPGESGYSSIVANFGSIRNEGIELELSTAPVATKHFNWNLGFNMSINRNKILDLGPGVSYYNFTSGGADYTHRLTVGGRLGDFWGYKTDGLLSQDDIQKGYPTLVGAAAKAGMVKMVDENHSGTLNDSDKVFLGNALPKITLGLDNTFTLGNWTLNIFVYAPLGQKVLNQNLLYSTYGSPVGVPSEAYIKDHYTAAHPNAHYPIPSNYGPNFQTTDRLVEDASFLRFKTITLAYTFNTPAKWLSKLRIYATGNNLITITQYSGYDPEVSSYGQNILLPGIDIGSYPRTRMYTFGINATF
jgi:TonB-dependent starch-binding outer membrane protein SusC